MINIDFDAITRAAEARANELKNFQQLLEATPDILAQMGEVRDFLIQISAFWNISDQESRCLLPEDLRQWLLGGLIHTRRYAGDLHTSLSQLAAITEGEQNA